MSETNLKELYDYVPNAPDCGNCKNYESPLNTMTNANCSELHTIVHIFGLCDLHKPKEVANG